MKCLIASIVLIIVSMTATAFGQGIAPLSPETLAQAIAFGESASRPRMLNDPLIARQRAMNDARHVMRPTERAEFMTATKVVPFQFTIVTPFITAAEAAAEAKRRYAALPTLDIAQLNTRLIMVHVQPGETITTADAIEDMVIKRAGAIIRPLTKSVRPLTVSTLGGASTNLSEGDFVFDFETFTPNEPIVLAMIGRRATYEWTVLTDDLALMK